MLIKIEILLLASPKYRITGKNIGGKYRFTGHRSIRQNIGIQSELRFDLDKN